MRRRSPRLSVARCHGCGHRTSTHADVPTSAPDYHEQYDAGAFLDALARTRRRQAARIVEAIERHGGAGRVLDIGAGRGWFVDACRARGFGPIEAVEPSAVGRAELAAADVAHSSMADVDGGPWGVVALLDVLEHMPPSDALALLRGVRDHQRPSLVVVKVPVPGPLYALSAIAASVGRPAALEQLWQVGTSPPHLSYFDRRSLERLHTQAGLEVIAMWEDAELDAGGGRTSAPRVLERAIGLSVGVVARAGRGDTVVALSRPAASV